MKKYILDLTVSSIEKINERTILVKLTDTKPLPDLRSGQFVEVKVDGSTSTFLRRPISVHFVDRDRNELWLLIALVGNGTRKLADLQIGSNLNCVLPLGNNFTMPKGLSETTLLVGGGVGVAPLLLLGKELCDLGLKPLYLLGARNNKELPRLTEFEKYGEVYITTEDGSKGERGFVIDHSLLRTTKFDRIYTCGPKGMMIAIANFASKNDIYCEASLENLMACGIGACLCCVEKTKDGNLCVCNEGPVFDTRRLLW